MQRRLAWYVLAMGCPVLTAGCPQFEQDFAVDAGASGAADSSLVTGEAGNGATQDAEVGSSGGGTTSSGSSGSRGGADSGSTSGADAAPCSPGASRCSGSSVETCGPSGVWGIPWSCATGTCSSNGCAGFTTTGASCQTSGAGLSNCGTNSDSCCRSPEVPGGTYDRTYTNSGEGGMGEAAPATVSGFRLDEYLVTVGRFRQFVNAVLPSDGGAGWLPPTGSGKHAHLNGGQGLVNVGADAGAEYETGWVASDDINIAPTNTNLACAAGFDTWTNAAGSQENLPINCVNWYESYAFCIWDGGFLPSEAEWEYAAAGGTEQRAYPWGSTDPGTSNQYAIYGCLFPSESGSCTGASNIAPVGAAPLGTGLWGQLDMAGDVFEWNLDWFAINYVDPCTDCADLNAASFLGDTRGPQRVHGGGDFSHLISYLLPSARNIDPPATRNSYIGFRCARTP